ncbi:MAG: hypothetical protein JW896_13010, partial [Deltaproteobacteria bacterium]|nr:hypothetical protein [Deltaproteobacteria bacterium]
YKKAAGGQVGSLTNTPVVVFSRYRVCAGIFVFFAIIDDSGDKVSLSVDMLLNLGVKCIQTQVREERNL